MKIYKTFLRTDVRKPMKVKDLREALAGQPDNAKVAWVDKDGKVGYFFEDEMNIDADDGHVHLDLGYLD